MKLTCYTFELAERHKLARDNQTARQTLQRSTRSIRLIVLILGPETTSIYRFTFRLPLFGPTWTHQLLKPRAVSIAGQLRSRKTY